MRLILCLLITSVLVISCTEVPIEMTETRTRFSTESVEPGKLLSILKLGISDQRATYQEIQDYVKKTKTVEQLKTEWINSADFKPRIARYVDETITGVQQRLRLISPNFQIKTDSNGIVYLPARGTCLPADATQVEAWWLEPGETTAVCNNIISGSMLGNGGIFCGIDQFMIGGPANGCGCGPKMVNCILGNHLGRIKAFYHEEFQERAWEAFQNNRSWEEFLAGSYLYVNRWGYHKYLRNLIFGERRDYTATELANLQSVPTDTYTMAPPIVGLPTAGLVTSPGYTRHNNNHRSRTRGITERFLCQSVGGQLNTSGITEFVNPSMSAADKAHGEQEGCADCHYFLDNAAWAIINFDQFGRYRNNRSELAHMFGQDGSGSSFYMNAFVSNGPGFKECRAQKGWRDFSSQPWDDLSEAQRTRLINAAGVNLRTHVLETIEVLHEMLKI